MSSRSKTKDRGPASRDLGPTARDFGNFPEVALMMQLAEVEEKDLKKTFVKVMTTLQNFNKIDYCIGFMIRAMRDADVKKHPNAAWLLQALEVSLSDAVVLKALREAHEPERVAFKTAIDRVMGLLKLAPEPVFGPPAPLPPKGTPLPDHTRPSIPLAPTPPPSPTIQSGWQMPFGLGDVVNTNHSSCVAASQG
ncbi:hypothetical protein NLI96_g12871 [Meripilus lineatus]|uniref:Uncharacterized protein n=1 Tax=Meripilus lineatus TaxID=2056292 RepID=A0AAD5USZ6_9APHY|nr:hypothetical protein NLI96_g12871 [Physisporinus lineatus]